MSTLIKFFSTTCLLLIFIFFAPVIFAENINLFNSQITAHQDGTMDITETIDYNFGDLSRHGIFRDIPKIAKVGDLYRVMEISVMQVLRDGQPETYRDNSSSSEVSLKIGNPDKTITGNHTYEISYLVRNGIGSNFDDHDEIYWNVTGNGWNVPILSATAAISTDFGVVPNKSICYTGSQGSTLQGCQISRNSNFSVENLGVYQGLTAVAGFPVNTFPKSILQKQIPGSASVADSQINQFVLKLIIYGIIIEFYFSPGFINLVF